MRGGAALRGFHGGLARAGAGAHHAAADGRAAGGAAVGPGDRDDLARLPAPPRRAGAAAPGGGPHGPGRAQRPRVHPPAGPRDNARHPWPGGRRRPWRSSSRSWRTRWACWGSRWRRRHQSARDRAEHAARNELAACASRLARATFGVTGLEGEGLVLLLRPMVVDLHGGRRDRPRGCRPVPAAHLSARPCTAPANCQGRGIASSPWPPRPPHAPNRPPLPLRRMRLDHREMGGTLRRMPGVGNRRGNRPRRRRTTAAATVAEPGPAHRARSTPPPPPTGPPASANWTGCSAAAWCPAP